MEIDAHYDLNEGSVNSLDDLGVGNRKAAILEELTKLKKIYADRPQAMKVIDSAIAGIESAGEDVLTINDWYAHSDVPYILMRGQTDLQGAESADPSKVYWGHNEEAWKAGNMIDARQVTAIVSKEGFKIRANHPESPEQWQVVLAAFEGHEAAISNVNASAEIEIAVGNNWTPSPEPTIPIIVVEKSTRASPTDRGIKRSRDKTIYGVDDRREIYEINWPEAYKWSKGVASIGNRSEARIHEKGYCTAFLISPNKAITNSHCINGKDFYSKVLRFGDQYVAEGIPDKIESFTIAEILVWDVPFDIAVLQLNPGEDGEHAGASYPVLPLSGWPRDLETPLYMIGHPEGHMKKFAPNCKIIRRPYRDDELGKHILGVDCDAFGGNSGSPIFDANTHQVIAFLWGGQLDTQEFEEATEFIHEFAVPLELINKDTDFRYGAWPGDVLVSLESGAP